MNTLREAAQQALEALEWSWGGEPLPCKERDAITALKAALAEHAREVGLDYEPTRGDRMRDKGFTRRPTLREIAVDEPLATGDKVSPTQPVQDAYGYASRLAVAIWKQHYKNVAPQWKPLDDLMGVLTQIDNMTSGLTRQAEPVQEPVAWRWSESGGARWFDWTTDWSHHERAKAMGCAIQYATPAQGVTHE